MEDSDTNTEDKNTGIKLVISHALIVFLGVMAGTFFFLFLAAIFFGDPIRDSVMSAVGILVKTAHPKITPDESTIINKMVAEGVILPANNLVGAIIAYYQSVIDMFVAVLAILGVLAYFYIRSVSARDAEKMAEKAVKVHIDSGAFRDVADSAFNRSWKSKTEEAMSDLEDTVENIETYKEATIDLEKKLKDVESRLLNIEEKLTEDVQIDTDESKEHE